MKLKIDEYFVSASLLRCGDIIKHDGHCGQAVDVMCEAGVVRFNVGAKMQRYTVKEAELICILRRPIITNTHSDGTPFINPHRYKNII